MEVKRKCNGNMEVIGSAMVICELKGSAMVICELKRSAMVI